MTYWHWDDFILFLEKQQKSCSISITIEAKEDSYTVKGKLFGLNATPVADENESQMFYFLIAPENIVDFNILDFPQHGQYESSNKNNKKINKQVEFFKRMIEEDEE